MGIESDVEIDRCHRIGPCKTKTGQNRGRPRTVGCRLNRFKNKKGILNNAKNPENTGIFIYEDFQKTPWNLESHYGNKFLNIINNINSHAQITVAS